MVKQKYEEIVSIQTGAVPEQGSQAGYYYYDARPNTPKKLLFKKTSAAEAYNIGTTQNIPTVKAFWGAGARKGEYITDKSGNRKYIPLGSGRHVQKNIQKRKTPPLPYNVDKRAAIMEQLTPEQRAGVSLGTLSLTKRTNRNLWDLKETAKKLAQRQNEKNLMLEFGEGGGRFAPSIWGSERISPNEVHQSLEYDPRSAFAQDYGKYVRSDPTDFKQEYGTGYNQPYWAQDKSARIQYEADQVFPAQSPFWKKMWDDWTGLKMQTEGQGVLHPLPKTILGSLPWDNIQENLNYLSGAGHAVIDPINPAYNWADKHRPGLVPDYSNPAQGGDSIHGPFGYLDAINKQRGGGEVDMFNHYKTRERQFLEGSKRLLNIFDPANLNFFIQAGQLPAEILRGGLSPGAYAESQAEKWAIADAKRRPDSIQTRAINEYGDYAPTGEVSVNWPNEFETYPRIDRRGYAEAVGAALAATVAAIPSQLGEAHSKDPDLFWAQAGGDLLSLPLSYYTLGKFGGRGRALSSVIGGVTEPVETAAELIIRSRYPNYKGPVGLEELALHSAMKAGDLGLRGAEAAALTLDDFALRHFNKVIIDPAKRYKVDVAIDGGSGPGTILGGFHLPTNVPLGDLTTKPTYLAELFYAQGGQTPGSRRGTALFPGANIDIQGYTTHPDPSSYLTIANSNPIDTIGGRLGTFDRITPEFSRYYPDARLGLFDEIDTGMVQSRTRQLSPGATISDATYLDMGPWISTGQHREMTWDEPGTVRNMWGKESEYDFDDFTDAQIERMNRGAEAIKAFEKRRAKALTEGRYAEGIYPFDAYTDSEGNTDAATAQDIYLGAGAGAFAAKLTSEQKSVLVAELKHFARENAEMSPDVINSKMYRGTKMESDLMQEPTVLTPREFLELEIAQRNKLQNPFDYPLAPGEIGLDFSTQNQLMSMQDEGLSFDLLESDSLLQQPILTPLQESILGEESKLASDDVLSFSQEYDLTQDEALKLKLRARSKLKSRFKADFKRRKGAIKKIRSARNRLEQTRRKFIMDLFKNEIAIPNVLIPSVNIPQVHIPAVRVPQVHIPAVRVPRVHIPTVNVPQVHVPAVRVPKVHVPEVTGIAVNVPSVNIPKVEVYK